MLEFHFFPAVSCSHTLYFYSQYDLNSLSTAHLNPNSYGPFKFPKTFLKRDSVFDILPQISVINMKHQVGNVENDRVKLCGAFSAIRSACWWAAFSCFFFLEVSHLSIFFYVLMVTQKQHLRASLVILKVLLSKHNRFHSVSHHVCSNPASCSAQISLCNIFSCKLIFSSELPQRSPCVKRSHVETWSLIFSALVTAFWCSCVKKTTTLSSFFEPHF